MHGPRRLARLSDSTFVLGLMNWLARWTGFAWVGLLTFLIYPATKPDRVSLQAAAYAVSAAGLAAWVLIDYWPAVARYRARALPVVLGLIAVACACGAAAGDGGTTMVIFAAVAAMAAGSDADLGTALAVTVAGILANEITALAVGSGYGSLLGLPLVIAAGTLLGRNRGAYRIQAEQAAILLAQRERLAAERRRADLLDERTRIAREIHDVLAHSLGALSIQIQAARSVLTDSSDVEKAGELLAGAQRMASEGLVETRRAVQALRADTLPLSEELANVAQTYAERYGVTTSFDTSGPLGAVPPDVTLALLRIAQEALVNAAKHAPGQPVTVRLDAAGPGAVRLTVRNDLPVAGPDRDGQTAGGADGVRTADAGYGLTGMRERLRMLNGTLEAGGRDGQWIVTAEAPLPAQDSQHPGDGEPETMAS
jgi:signal transduction histidine kinase